MKQDSQPTDRSHRQHLHTLEFSYHLLPAFSSPLSSILLSLLPFPTCDMRGGSTFFCLSPCFCTKRRQDCRWVVTSVCVYQDWGLQRRLHNIHYIYPVLADNSTLSQNSSFRLINPHKVGFLNCVFFSGFSEVGSRYSSCSSLGHCSVAHWFFLPLSELCHFWWLQLLLLCEMPIERFSPASPNSHLLYES